MHQYAREEPDRKQYHLYVALASLAVAILLSAWVDPLTLPAALAWIKPIVAPSAVLFYGVAVTLFDQLLWRLRIGPVHISSIPDIGGTWVGAVHSNFGVAHQPTESYLAVLAITQTWSKIRINFETDFAESGSLMAVVSGPRDAAKLRYEYEVHPLKTAEASAPEVQRHNGVAHVDLTLGPHGTRLKGGYYTGDGFFQHEGGLLNFQRLSRSNLSLAAIRMDPELKQKLAEIAVKLSTKSVPPLE